MPATKTTKVNNETRKSRSYYNITQPTLGIQAALVRIKTVAITYACKVQSAKRKAVRLNMVKRQSYRVVVSHANSLMQSAFKAYIELCFEAGCLFASELEVMFGARVNCQQSPDALLHYLNKIPYATLIGYNGLKSE